MGSDEERHSHSIDPEVIADPVERTHRETRNGLLQAEQVLEWVENFTADGRPFRLRPSMILSLHRTAMEGVKHLAGTWRTGAVEIVGSKHIPQAAYLVPGQVEEMCDWIEERWATATAVELAAYAMWRMNWIHPFVDGNGRTARAVSYLVLCAKLGYRLPGLKTIPEHIAANRNRTTKHWKRPTGEAWPSWRPTSVICSRASFSTCTSLRLGQAH
ncbi:MAG: Fic family protein [Acidobacteriota bacterium]